MERASYWRSPWGWHQGYHFLTGMMVLAVVMAVSSSPEDEPIFEVVVRFLVVAPAVAAVMTLVFYRVYWWPSLRALSSVDRRQVRRSVAWGEGPTDPRLAPTVAEAAAHILRRTAKPDPTNRLYRYDRWFAYALIGGWSAFALFMTLVERRAITATALWAVIVVPFLFRNRLRALHAEIRANAERAEAAAGNAKHQDR